MAKINNVDVTPSTLGGNSATWESARLDKLVSPTYLQNPKSNFFLQGATPFAGDLSGDYAVITEDDGWYSADASDDDGYLPGPYDITITCSEPIELLGFRVVGHEASSNWPVDYTLEFVKSNGTSTILNITDATGVEQKHLFESVLRDIVRIEFRVTRISKPNYYAHVVNLYSVYELERYDDLRFRMDSKSYAAAMQQPTRKHDVYFGLTESSEQKVSFSRNDTAAFRLEEKSLITNVHSVMKDPTRKVYGKVYITYFNPLLDNLLTFNSSPSTKDSKYTQLMNAEIGDGVPNYFTMYENDLSGNFVVADSNGEFGWSSANVTDANGMFDTDTFLEVGFSSRLLTDCYIIFDVNKGIHPVDFDITIYNDNGTHITVPRRGWASTRYDFVNDYSEVVKLRFDFIKMNKPNVPVIVTEIQVSSEILYTDDDLLSIDFMEELTFNDTVTTLGSISANETTVVISNIDKEFFYDNPNSMIKDQLRKNRKIVPWLGVEIVPDKIEWHRLGTFWSDQWDVPVEDLVASVTGYDTLYVLNNLSFIDHQVYENKSVKELLEIVFTNAKTQFALIEWYIEPALNDTIIKYAWFEKGTHTQALKKIASSGLINIFCDRQGVINCVLRRVTQKNYQDTWSDYTNVISKTYPSMYKLLSNQINVSVTSITVAESSQILNAQDDFSVINELTLDFQFNAPYLRNGTLSVNSDTSVTYTYEAYSWGVRVHFTGTGTVYSVSFVGDSLATKVSTARTAQDTKRILLDGLQQVTIAHDFIQSGDSAQQLADSILAITSDDNYYVEVSYIGDIVDTLGDPIRLLDGIAPSDRYILSRNKLMYDGSLDGEATLIT